ncbi:MAG: hydrogenase 3 maturation endopeptidase HyCI [Methanobrevibacter sp.]|jgi:hydrogenase 3 maturation protease|nr:hydrogenase 3 maturation endopeptidase HyCI [Candidatus Methanovirga basalitermitum]
MFKVEQLLEFIENYDKFLIFGIGNELVGDDGFGSLLIDNLKKEFSNSYLKKHSVILINSGSVPENFTGEIIKENPSHILIVDAFIRNEQSRIAEINNAQKIKNKVSGSILNIDENEMSKYNFSTHSMSLSFLIKYLRDNIDFKVFILGSEAKSMNLGDNLTENIGNSLNQLQNILIKTLKNME